jgi:hypothetical protein
VPLFSFSAIVKPVTIKGCQLWGGCVYSIILQIRRIIYC